MNVYKIVVLGLGGVGKSALTIQFIHSQFMGEYDPTIEDSYHKQIMLDSENCLLDILDTAGEEEYSAMKDQYMRDGQGFIFVYAMNSVISFDEIGRHYNDVCRVKQTTDFPACLSANKCDLVNERMVSRKDGEEMAEFINCPYFETSAKERTNVDELFYECVREIKKRDNTPLAPRRRK